MGKDKGVPQLSRASEREIERRALDFFISGGVGVTDPEEDSHLANNHGVSRQPLRVVESPDDLITGTLHYDLKTREMRVESYRPPMKRSEVDRLYGK
jgi:hypothetical protein